MIFNKYETKSSKRFKVVLKIIIAILILVSGCVCGYWFAGGFSNKVSKISTEKEFENYIDANIERLKIELDCIVEQNLIDLEYLQSISKHVNSETAKLEERLQRILEYKEELIETQNIINTIDNNLDRFKPYYEDDS